MRDKFEFKKKRKFLFNFSSVARNVDIKDVIVKPKKRNPRPHPPQAASNVNDNALVHEMRQKLKGRNLRDVIIDGANIGRTYVHYLYEEISSIFFSFRYGDSEFSARGIKLAVDLFQSYGYPDSKIVVIVPPHYLSKDKEHIFPNLIHRKIVHKAFQQKVDDKNKRFYDDR